MDIFMLFLLVFMSFCSGANLSLGPLGGNKTAKVVFPITILCTFLGIVAVIESNVKAIDVYRGKTELKITYQGNIPVDTVVVYKKN